MDEATIQKIAAEIARHLPTLAWVPLLAQVMILAAAAAMGAFFGEYLMAVDEVSRVASYRQVYANGMGVPHRPMPRVTSS
jgi:hypothetical protein